MGRCVYICDMNVKKFDNGGRTQRQRQLDRLARRFERRQPKEVTRLGPLSFLPSMNIPIPGSAQGIFPPTQNRIFVEADSDPSVEYHERLHAAQYGKLGRFLGDPANLERGRIQDPVLREGYKYLSDLYSGPEPDFDKYDTQEEALRAAGLLDENNIMTETGAGYFITRSPRDFEAVIKSGLKSFYDAGANVKQIAAGSSFEDMVGFINQNKETSNNARGLAKYANYLSKEGSDEQKKVFMDLMETEYGY